MRGLFRRLVDLGVTADTPLDLVIAWRATNVVALGLVAVSIVSAVAALLDARSPMLALGCLTLGLVYGVCLLLSAVGRLDAARRLFLAAGSANYLQFNLAVGHAGGGPIWIVAFVAFPVLAYTRAEHRPAIWAYLWMAISSS